MRSLVSQRESQHRFKLEGYVMLTETQRFNTESEHYRIQAWGMIDTELQRKGERVAREIDNEALSESRKK